MKKLLLLLCLICLAGPVAFGQKSPKSVERALRALLRPTQGKIASITAGLTDKQLEKVIVKLQAENAALERQTAAQTKLRQKVLQESRPSVFKATRSQVEAISFSGTVFKAVYRGKEEIFGVVPMHVLRDAEGVREMLSYKFNATISTKQGVKTVPAWVVQISSSKTGDVALVKFRKEDEKILSPLMISPTAPTFPQQAYAQGFACNILAGQSFELVGKTSTDALLAQIPAANEGARAGFCGSPVLNDKTQLIGVHVGSSYQSQEPVERAFFAAFKLSPVPQEGDMGYITPSSYLEKLVTAYHHPSAKPFAVVIGGYEITRLKANEYVSRIELLDKDQQILWTKSTNYKVSYSAAETVLRLRPETAYVRVQIGRSHWVQGEKGWYVENTDGVFSVLYPLPPAALRE